jgi:hypothetical protein
MGSTGPSPAAAFLWAAAAWSASRDAEQDKSLEDHMSYERLSHYFENHMDSILSRKRKVDELVSLLSILPCVVLALTKLLVFASTLRRSFSDLRTTPTSFTR